MTKDQMATPKNKKRIKSLAHYIAEEKRGYVRFCKEEGCEPLKAMHEHLVLRAYGAMLNDLADAVNELNSKK